MSVSREFVELFADESPRLLRFLRRFGPAISAEDVAQDAFARFAATDHDSIACPRAWLFKTARNLALNELKRSKIVRIEVVADVDTVSYPTDVPSPEDIVVAADEAARLRGAIAKLSERHRTSLLLFKVEGLSHKEIGRRLGVSHRTVERYIVQAITQCFELLRADAP